MTRLWETNGCLLEASGTAVGLPAGQMGNSEVGHMTIGAGRAFLQSLPRINRALAEKSPGKDAGKSVEHLPAFRDFMEKARQAGHRAGPGGTVHLIGLLSPGGVHAHQDHLVAFARLFLQGGLRVCLHAILDGRDTAPGQAKQALAFFQERVPQVRVETLSGRYYAMDRDKNIDRTLKAARGILGHPATPSFEAAEPFLADQLEHIESEEFLVPAKSRTYRGVEAGDSLFFANFRSDRMKQLSHVLAAPVLDPGLDSLYAPSPGLDPGQEPLMRPDWAAKASMTSYSPQHEAYLPCFFPSELASHTLGACVAEAGFEQLRIAETEKYAHVTYFFNAGQEAPYPGEMRHLVPSPRVARFDTCPEMAASAITDYLSQAVAELPSCALFVVNYANPDMVGHTGNWQATLRAIECVDQQIERLIHLAQKQELVLLITADHGNAEQMWADTQPHRAHTTHPVPFILYDPTGEKRLKACADAARPDGRPGDRPDDGLGELADIAPTVLALLGLPCPPAMTGHARVL